MLFTREGVSETKTTLGLEALFRSSTAFLIQLNAACTALTDLKYRRQQPQSLITSSHTLQVNLGPH